jgi:SAM-dependent methyltransferase
MKQSDIFLTKEGNAWLDRNELRLGERDLVSGTIEQLKIVPKHALEIGCSNGWRLARLRRRYSCKVYGVEPSAQAISHAVSHIEILQGTAEKLPAPSALFDVVIYGFCLYVTDPEDWFRIAAEGDRVLRDGGYLIIHDFDMTNAYPFARRYEHREGVRAYHVDFARLWLVHPWYHLVETVIAGGERVTVMQKHESIAVHA